MTPPSRSGASPRLVLAMLLLVYIFNYVDRQIIAILAAPIQSELGLDDAQMGLLGGIAFAVLYSTLAVPLAWLADRTSRSWVIAGSLTVWSLFTVLCGTAQGFWHIFLARLGVGVGEAGGVAPSYAVIADRFPDNRRAFALSVYSLGIPIGSAIGVLAGGYVAARVDWRTAFFVVGLAGVVVALPFKLIVREQPRPKCAVQPREAGFGDVAATLVRKPAFWLLAFGAASGSMVGYGYGFWLPSLMRRSFGLNLVETGWFLGAVLLLGGGAGILLGGVLTDRLGQAERAFHAWVPGLAYFLAVPLFAAAILSSNVWLAFALFLVPQALAYMWLGPLNGAVQNLVEPEARATASALFLLVNNLIGMGGGIYALGALSKELQPIYGSQALRISMLGALGLYFIAAFFMLLAGRALRRDWVDHQAR